MRKEPPLQPPIGRRIRAAMELAGLESFGALADEVDTPGLGERTLRKLADDNDPSRNPQRLHLIAIAEATGLPVEFFTVDFQTLTAPHHGNNLADRVALLEEIVTALVEVPGAPGQVVELARELEARPRNVVDQPQSNSPPAAGDPSGT